MISTRRSRFVRIDLASLALVIQADRDPHPCKIKRRGIFIYMFCVLCIGNHNYFSIREFHL
eukprot:COSAG02_NODE_1506_length_12232_cov_420.616088_2_plen_61_part_00